MKKYLSFMNIVHIGDSKRLTFFASTFHKYFRILTSHSIPETHHSNSISPNYLSISVYLAIPPPQNMGRRVSASSLGPSSGLYRAAHAGSGRQNVRKVNGIRPGVHQATVRGRPTARLQSHPHLPGRGLPLGRTLYSKSPHTSS